MTNLELKKYIDDIKEEFLSKVDNKEVEYKLNFAKVREVKSPCKSYDAAGWDFYVPENLTIKDFTKNVGIYVNDNLVNKTDVMSPTFLLKNADDKRELWIKFYQDRKTKEIKYFNCNSGLTIIPEWNAWIEHEHTYVKSIDLNTNEKILIPSGIHVNLPKNIFLKVDNKSGIASKRGLICGACIAEGSLIETNKGKFSVETLTKEFCDQNEILIKTKLADGSFGYKKCDGFRCTGEVETVNVKFDDGTEVTGATDHIICNNNGWHSLESI